MSKVFYHMYLEEKYNCKEYCQREQGMVKAKKGQEKYKEIITN